MKEIVISNEFHLTDSDVTDIVKRVKILLINSKNEILLGYSYHAYQFPGGHVEDGESLVEAVNREIEEETGIVLNIKEIEPFAVGVGYYKDWPEVGKNRKNEIYYYEVKTDELPNLANTNYTEEEKVGNFELRYIPLEKVEEELKDNVEKYGNIKGIATEMLNLFKIYKEM